MSQVLCCSDCFFPRDIIGEVQGAEDLLLVSGESVISLEAEANVSSGTALCVDPCAQLDPVGTNVTVSRYEECALAPVSCPQLDMADRYSAGRRVVFGGGDAHRRAIHLGSHVLDPDE